MTTFGFHVCRLGSSRSLPREARTSDTDGASVLMVSRGSCPYLQPDELRSRSPHCKRVTCSMYSFGQAMPATFQDQERTVQTTSFPLFSPTLGWALQTKNPTDIGETPEALRKDDPTVVKCKQAAPERVMESMQSETEDCNVLLQFLPAMEIADNGETWTTSDDAKNSLNQFCPRLQVRQAMKAREFFFLMLLLPLVFLCRQYHDGFAQYRSTATLAEWNVLQRASSRSRCEAHVSQSDGPDLTTSWQRRPEADPNSP